MLLTFIAGLAVGAVVAVTTARAKRKGADLAKDASAVLGDLKERSRLAAADLKRGIADAVTHHKQPAKVRSSAAPVQTGDEAEATQWF
jgi:hypothetical protein